MQKVMINQYKRQDVFSCQHKAHFRFEHNVSVYHVLKEKKCYPQGCVYFLWKCRLLNKGHSCPKGYEHVGKKCFSCKNYFEEKICYQPEVLLAEDEFIEFKEKLEEFEDWLFPLIGKEIEFSGTVHSVKPHFRKFVFGRKQSLSFIGFLLIFKEGYIGRVLFKDYVYVNISTKLQKKYDFSKGDKVEFLGQLSLDRGRVILNRIRRIEFDHKISESTWDVTEALVAKNIGTHLDCQPEKCLICEKGCLLDVVEKNRFEEKNYRHLFCLAGMPDPEVCIYNAKKKLKRESLLKDHQ